MSLLQLLADELAPVLAKRLFLLWARGARGQDDPKIPLRRLVAQAIENPIAQGQASRLFGEVAELVIQQLEPLLQSDGTLRGADARGILTTFSTALGDYPLTGTILQAHNLSATQMTQDFVRATADHQRGLSAAERAVYERLASEVFQYLVEVSLDLPSYKSATMGALLQNQRTVLASVQALVDDIARLRAKVLGETATSSDLRFETVYRRALLIRLDELQLLGLDVSLSARRYSLTSAYVSMPIGGRSRHKSKVMPAEYALDNARHFLLTGPPGSGKTTLLRWLAVQAASASFPPVLDHWSKLVPFYVPLRRCHGPSLPTAEDLIGVSFPALKSEQPPNWASRLLEEGRGLLLIDGVDEVTQSKRDAVRCWLLELLSLFPKVKMVVTSRPHAAEVGWLRSPTVVDLSLAPMDLPAIRAFVDRWHQSVAYQFAEPERTSHYSQLADSLFRAIRETQPIRDLASNPLLCAALCALHRDRNRQLPRDRIELYEACSHMLLDRRDLEREVELGDYPHLNYRQKRALLEDLAYHLLRNESPSVSTHRVDARFEKRIVGMPGLQGPIDGPLLRKLFVERSGFLREAVPGEITFAHLTFQEFLAAQAIVNEEDYGYLLKMADDDRWRETIVLAAGLASRRGREQIIRGLLGPVSAEGRLRTYLAFACVGTTVELGEEVRSAVLDAIARLSPPRTPQEAEAFAAVGRLAVDYLRLRPGMDVGAMVHSLIALGQIGDDDSLAAIAEYARDKNELQRVLRWPFHFEKLWERFDRVQFVQRVLHHLVGRAGGLTLLGLKSIEGILELDKLQSLVLTRCELLDLTQLAGLSRLKVLRICNSQQLARLDGLEELTALEELSIIGCPELQSLSHLESLEALRTLRVNGCPGVRDYSPVGAATSLEHLEIYDWHAGSCIPGNLAARVSPRQM